MSSKPKTATVLGFGSRAPAPVLDLLTKALTDRYLTQIVPCRSQAMELALLAAPYRTFLRTDDDADADATDDNNKPPSTTATRDLLVYCLPSSVTEYLQNLHEASQVRSTLLLENDRTVVAIYNPVTDCMVGHDNDSSNSSSSSSSSRIRDAVLEALTSHQTHLQPQQPQPLAAAAAANWHALTQLDQQLYAIPQLLGGLPQGRRHDVVVLVGSGGREHALAIALAQSPLIAQVICCPGNGGTAVQGGKVSNCAATGIMDGQQQQPDHDTVIRLVQTVRAAMVVVGPEAPLVEGLIDALHQSCPDVLAFGPTQAAAELEASKAFAKDFLQQHGIPTAKYQTFTDPSLAIAYVESLDETDRQVVKASGLAAGKGVLLPTTKAETIQAIHEIMFSKAFGAAGDTCVIESFLTGPEASCLAFCDGKTAKLMPAAQDHKRALDQDQGLNTGGMGAYAPAPCVTPQLHQAIEKMCIQTVQQMAQRGTPYVGVLYAGMILTPNGPYVLEFNCRFGDPETQVLLPLLETDLYEIMTACCQGTLGSVDVRFKENKAAATVVGAAQGYPETYPKGMKITGLAEANAVEGVQVYHAGTVLAEDGSTRCAGGRVIAVTGVGSSLQSALKTAYNGMHKLDFVGDNGEHLMHYRTDIGRKAVEKKLRIGVLGSTRGTALIPVMEACTNGDIPAEIVAVVSNKSDALILEKGRALGPTVLAKYVSAKGLTRAQYGAECTAALLGAGVDYVLLVGYMRILSKPFTDFWKGRCINVHPSLLPKHAGGMDLAVHQAVIDAKEQESGCTVHQVTEVVDGGAIVVQKRVTVEPNDTAESLKAKVQPLEGPAFIEAIASYCRGQIIRYEDAGVSIDAGNKLVDLIKPYCKATRRLGCDADLGGFGGLFDLAAAGYDSSETILIGATDGVGTKLRIAQAMGKHATIGIDLVAMCVNDLIVAGGEPLFFLDYFASGHLDVEEAAEVVKGVADGCQQANCGLIGGETAEMPSMYAPGDYDLAGFSVGAVNRNCVLPRNVCKGDVLLGIASSGVHSNGFSLVRKLVEKEGLLYSSPCPWDSQQPSIGDALLTPTKIYVKSCLPLIKQGLVKGMAHITGGGLVENLPRSLPVGLSAQVVHHPPLPPVFAWMKKVSGLDDKEMLRTFNCGVGMVLIVSKENAQAAKELLVSGGEGDVCEMGVLVEGDGQVITQFQLS